MEETTEVKEIKLFIWEYSEFPNKRHCVFVLASSEEDAKLLARKKTSSPAALNAIKNSPSNILKMPSCFIWEIGPEITW